MTLGSMDHGEGSAAQLIKLEPLIHQVSGHSSLWVLDDVTVCKPLIGREAKFYCTLPPQMRGFTPEFRGTVKVLVQRTAEGVAVAAVPPTSSDRLKTTTYTPATVTANTKHHSSTKGRRVGPSSVASFEAGEEEGTGGGAGGEQRPSITSPPRVPPTHNPWLRQCHQRYLNKLKQKVETTTNIMECILLENLTHVYRVPNVLDLKMGTRQYGDDAPESKRRSQTRKAQHTTTPRLGVRLAGMQVFNRDTKCYVCKNKYVGRELSEDGFQQTLRHFLHNGRRFRTDIVEQIICKLTDLRKVVATLDSFRFFTSSLLILYDSYDANGPSKSKDTSAVREKDKHTDQENRNKSRERSDRRQDSSGSQAEDGINRANSKEALVKDISKRDSVNKVSDSCIAKRRDSPVSNDNKESCSCDGGECSVCGGSGSSRSSQQKTKQRRSGSSNTAPPEGAQPRQQSCDAITTTASPLLHTITTTATSNTIPISARNTVENGSGNAHDNEQGPNKNLEVITAKHTDNGRSINSDGATGASSLSINTTAAVTNTTTSTYRTKVDIRLIDFAHATHKGMGDPTTYTGPDEGLMLGLKSLINIFTDIKDIYMK